MQSGAIEQQDRHLINITLLINSFEDSSGISFHAVEREDGSIFLPSRALSSQESVQQCIDSLIEENLILQNDLILDCKLIDIIDTIGGQNGRKINIAFNLVLDRKDSHYFNKRLSLFKNEEVFEIIKNKKRISEEDASIILIASMGISRQSENAGR